MDKKIITILLSKVLLIWTFDALFYCRVDVDKDEKLSFSEIEGWIMDKTQEHFDEALEENAHVFKHLDPNNKGTSTCIFSRATAEEAS